MSPEGRVAGYHGEAQPLEHQRTEVREEIRLDSGGMELRRTHVEEVIAYDRNARTVRVKLTAIASADGANVIASVACFGSGT